MADQDIDIEEHDVLDNPAIRSIFPDISVIKKEISQYYEDVDIKPDPEPSIKCESKSREEIVSTNAPKEVWNNDRNPPVKPLVDIVDISYFDIAQKKTETQHRNKIILGSKPSHDVLIEKRTKQKDVDSTIRVPKVVLQDLGAYIYRTNRYCKECLTLFSSRLDFDRHKRKVHTMIKKKTGGQEASKPEHHKNMCKICNTSFSTIANLNRHCRNVHKKMSTKSENNSTSKTSTITRSKINLILKNKHENSNIQFKKSSLKQNRNKCSICASILSSESSLKRHYENIHNKYVTFKSSPKTTVTASYKKNVSRNSSMKKIMRSHKNKIASKTNLCFHCKETFPDKKSLIDHIYEVLEPRRLLKQQLSKKIPQKVALKKLRESTIKKNTERIQNVLPGKSLRDKLIYENQDSDDNISDHFDSDQNNGIEDFVTNTSQKKKDNLSSVAKLKKVKEYSDNEVTSGSDSDHVECEENIENVNFETNILQTQNENTISSDRNLLDNIEKHESSTDRIVQNRQCKSLTKKSLRVEQLKQDFSNKNCEKEGNQSLKLKQNKTRVTISNSRYQNRSRSLKRKQIHEDRYVSSDKRRHSEDSDVVEISNKNSPSRNTTNNEPTEVIPIKRQCSVKFEGSHSDGSYDEGDNEYSNANADKKKGEMVYECVYCSYMLETSKAYYKHVTSKHKVVNISHAHKVKFYDQCKYCPSKSIHVAAHNLHLYKYHYDLVYKQFPNKVAKQKSTRLKNPMFRKFESFVLESIIYKCNKCDVHFSSSCITKDHEKHMELLINWKCSICGRIFKKHDKHLHLKQHEVSKTLNVCEFTATEIDRLLYNCTKCAIHFTEERYMEHFLECDEQQATDSVYCKKCDILIDKCGYKNHESYHELGDTLTDFTFVAADILDVAKNNEVVIEKKRKRLYEQFNCYTFCPTCKCYLTDIGLSRKTHIEARCSQIPKLICNLCGLLLTCISLKAHRNRHKGNKDLNLNSFKFFNFKGTPINPPVPEYPSCMNCDVRFVSKNAVKSHICAETDFLNCDICNIKLSENAFKLHMQFHDYRIPYMKKETLKPAIEKETSQAMTSETHVQNIKSDITNVDKISNPNSNSEITVTCNPEDVKFTQSKSNIIMYSCQSCNVAVDTYDKVVEHCQNHFNPTQKNCTESRICPKCSKLIENNSYENHQKLFHSSCDIIQHYIFDPMYFTCDNDTWTQHVFAQAPPAVRKEILSESIYQHECRIKMENVQKGPFELTVYKCDNCGNCIDPDCLFSHIKGGCRKNIRVHPCAFCGLPFMSTNFRSKHEIIHRRYDSIRIKSYNMVLINRKAHSTYTNNIMSAVNNFVLYQCRICDVAVDRLQRDDHKCSMDGVRKCSVCKLLVYRTDYDSHASKHKHFDMFETSNMKLILFGNKDEFNLKKITPPGFRGMICDYFLYKCAECEICLENDIVILNHTCIFDESKCRCHICGFYIASDSLKKHMDMHNTNLEFKTENIRIISFNSSKRDDCKPGQTTEETSRLSHKKCNVKEQDTDAPADITPLLEGKGTKAPDSNNGDIGNGKKENASVLYKCTCGLHYKDELNAKKCCTDKIKVARQTCTKCSLVFNPKELFSHLITDHGDKNKTCIYNIVEISPENECDVKKD